MSILSNMVLKDHADADVTFTPRDVVSGVATLVHSDGVPVGEKVISISQSRTTTGRRKFGVKLSLPVVQDVVVAGISRPTIVRTGYADLTLSFDGTSNADEREDLLSFLRGVLANTTNVRPLVESLDYIR